MTGLVVESYTNTTDRTSFSTMPEKSRLTEAMGQDGWHTTIFSSRHSLLSTLHSPSPEADALLHPMGKPVSA